ncbi:uncharacterized protein K452DRAFT_145303 [Aplosporella prunicola CBS 121167]|uniref:Uncharacterized protein n=1 Tax=Aplosporella prunicola CBS 121167 TaxID=1176127 RepID=A0A6A6BP85_9PEZI|nr:uncharacterized protein K452DRAFT_145303 [Aplosporella prunicola CBS 121167]KAF2144667.1 hypothetical protein K452DRAFT_145303 [Aplosporella prunicola CBS 121167]
MQCQCYVRAPLGLRSPLCSHRQAVPFLARDEVSITASGLTPSMPTPTPTPTPQRFSKKSEDRRHPPPFGKPRKPCTTARNHLAKNSYIYIHTHIRTRTSYSLPLSPSNIFQCALSGRSRNQDEPPRRKFCSISISALRLYLLLMQLRRVLC